MILPGIRLVLLFALAPICFAAALGTAARAETVTVASIPERIRSANPSLRAARLRVEEARGRFQGAGRLANPSLSVELKHDRKFEEGTLTLSFDQSFPVTARLRLEKVLSHKAIAAAELEIRDAERRLIAEAMTVAVKLAALARQRELRRQQVELAGGLAQFAEKRAQMGEISALDAAQARVDSQRMALELNQLEIERVTLTGELKMKLGSTATSPLVVAGGLAAPVRASSSASSATAARPKAGAMYGPVTPRHTLPLARPDYQKAKLAEETARTEVELAKAKKWDDFSAGLLVEGERARDEPEELDRAVYMGFRITVPLPLWNQNQGEIREKQAGARRALLETKALELEIAGEAELARTEMLANAQLASETQEKLMPLVIAQTDRLEQAYKRGEVDMLTVLRSREQRLALESAVLDATRNYHLARIRYDAATGRHTASR